MELDFKSGEKAMKLELRKKRWSKSRNVKNENLGNG